MLRRVITNTLIGLSFTSFSFAGTMGDVVTNPSFFYIGAYGGYGAVSGGYKHDGNVAQGRLSLGHHVKQYENVFFGGEIGIQSGNTMRLEASPSVINPATDLPPQATLKPLIDLLFTAKGQILPEKNLYYLLKGGIAYRQLQLDDRTATYGDGLSNVTGELQAGLGMNITQHVFLNVFYQGIYSNSTAGVTLDSAGNTPISHIPTQQAGFLGIEYSFF